MNIIQNKNDHFKNRPVIGITGKGRAHHPWDGLKKCPKCGGYPWMAGKDKKDFYSGAPYMVMCLNKKCDCRSISSDDISQCINDWNTKS